jgi:general secretion pathway protein D
MNTGFSGRHLWFGVLVLILSGCAGPRAFKAAEALRLEGKHDAAVVKFSEAVAHSPENFEYRLNLSKTKNEAAWLHLKAGRSLVAQEQYAEALDEYRQSLALDPSLAVAAQEFERTESLVHAAGLVAEAEDFYRTRRLANAKHNLKRALEILPGDPKALALLTQVQQSTNSFMDGFELDIVSDKPITLTFKKAKTKEVFNVLSQLSGIHFIFDEELKEQNISLSLENATFSQAMELLLRMNDLGKKVLNSKTIIIYSNSKEKRKQYDDHLIQVFYLSNIEAKKAVNLLRTMLQLRKIYVHEELNALIIRDKPEVIKLAQQILEAADRGDSEVVLDLELIEVTHNNTLNIGPKLSAYSVSFGLSNPGSGKIVADSLTSGSTTTSSAAASTTTGLASNLVSGLSNLEVFYTLPTATFEAQKKLTDSEVLANPRIRVKNKEKAKVHIGSREPVITVTVNGDQTSENIQYVDVGVKLDVEPSIKLDNTVVTKLSLEVSNATRLTALKSGTTPLQISTTNASTVLILKDGEQTIIGGLLRDDESKSKSMIPFLSDIPLLGWLFTGHSNTNTKREILLSITPHIVKNLNIPESTVSSIWSGSEDDLRGGPNFGSFAVFKPELENPLPISAPGLGMDVFTPPVLPANSGVSVLKAADKKADLIGKKESFLIESAEVSSIPEETSADSTVLPLESSGRALSADSTGVVETVLPAAQDVGAATAQARIYISGSTLVSAGQNFSLEVMADEVSDLYSAPLFVAYDSSKLVFVRAEEGDLLRQGGQATLFTVNDNPEKGEVLVGYKQGPGGVGVSGGGRLFRVIFNARVAGSTKIGLERNNFRTTAGTGLAVATTPFSLEIR